MKPVPGTLLDRFAIGLSGLCLLHCMAGFVMLSLFALTGDLLDHRVHVVGLALAMPLAASSPVNHIKKVLQRLHY
jgi:hypothetical protein